MRTWIFSMCLALCVLTLAANSFYNLKIAQDNTAAQSQPGVYVYEKGTSPYAVDFYLSGEWEYYPGILLYTQENLPSFEGGIGAFDPAAGLDRNFQETETLPDGFAEKNTREETDYEQFERRSVPIPFLTLRGFFDHSQDQVSSYRMVMEGLPQTQDFDMLLSLQGLMFGDFEVYIDGNHVSALLPPYGYPTYYFPVPASGTVEIVIQTRNTASLLNITPRVSFKGIAMESFDNYRNVILLLTAVIFTALILMMILLFSLDRAYLYLPFFMGLLFTGNYVINNLWTTGYQGAITSVIPQYLLPHLAWLMLAGALAMACLYRRTIYEARPVRLALTIALLLLLAALVIRLADLFLLQIAVGVPVSDLLTGIVIILLLALTYVRIREIPRAAFLYQTGLLLMITGMLSANLHNVFGFWNLFLYIQPLTIIIYTAFVFYTNKSNQIQLLRRTRELLEIEKKSSKIQAAMLSSQIQPHFLYNTLTTIQELCYSDPDAAAELIVNFSQYLRNNLDFMSYDDLIPFTTELEHIHNFMYIQNARHHGAIAYTEDIAFTDFLIPPLSVQPFVENAIKHGIMKNHTEGTVSLQVFETDHHIHITISNDGDPFREESLKPHHSIENIRTRLAYLMDGKVTICFGETQGTCVDISIPSIRKDLA